MFLIGGDVDDVAGLYFEDAFAFFLDAAHAGYDVEDLAFRVGVPVGPCAPGSKRTLNRPAPGCGI